MYHHRPQGSHSHHHVHVPENSVYYTAGSDLIRSELGSYGEKLVESSSQYMQTNISKYITNPHYYFQVNDQYVRNKLKVILFPFLHKGHWIRLTEEAIIGGERHGRHRYKPPIYDINAPDLYIPLMAFGSYLVLAGLVMGLHGKFSPEALNSQFTKGLVGWFMQVVMLKVALHLLGRGDAPLLDIVAYGGYVFTGATLATLARMIPWRTTYYYYLVTTWESFCMGVFLVKIIKRLLYLEMRSYDKHSNHHQHYLLLLVAVIQNPLLFWITNISV